MTVRPADARDAAAIALVHVQAWQAAYRGLIPQDYLAGLDASQRQAAWERRLAETRLPAAGTLVAEVDDRVVGFAHLCPTRDAGEDPQAIGEITSIYLAPHVWGRGIGKTLITASVDVLTRAGYQQATLWVLEANERARRFYQACGWFPDGAVKRDESRGFPLTEVRYRRPAGCPRTG